MRAASLGQHVGFSLKIVPHQLFSIYDAKMGGKSNRAYGPMTGGCPSLLVDESDARMQGKSGFAA
jgi:hypothetical protein